VLSLVFLTDLIRQQPNCTKHMMPWPRAARNSTLSSTLVRRGVVTFPTWKKKSKRSFPSLTTLKKRSRSSSKPATSAKEKRSASAPFVAICEPIGSKPPQDLVPQEPAYLMSNFSAGTVRPKSKSKPPGGFAPSLRCLNCMPPVHRASEQVE